MSIINDALKKVQNSLNNNPERKVIPADTPATGTNGASEFSAMAPAPAQPASGAPAPEPQTPPTAPSAAVKTTTAKAQSSKLVYILGSICLMIALFAPIVNHQSVFGLLIKSIKKNQKTPAFTNRSQKSGTANITATVAQKATEIKEELTKSISNLNAPASSTPSYHSGRRIILNGIMAQGNKNVALIDGQVYEAGEMVGTAKIITINSNNIVVEEDDLQRTIKVGQ